MTDIPKEAIQAAEKAVEVCFGDRVYDPRYIARAALTAALPHLTGWRPIETAPKDGTAIDGWDKTYNCRVTNMRWDHHVWRNGEPFGEKAWGAATMDGPAPNPSHWKPIPAPPETNKCLV